MVPAKIKINKNKNKNKKWNGSSIHENK